MRLLISASVAAAWWWRSPVDDARKEDPRSWSHLRVATKYPNVTRRHFAARGVQAECIKLNGAMELAPGLGLCRRIVDLVETGSTLVPTALSRLRRSPVSQAVLRSTARHGKPARMRSITGSAGSGRPSMPFRLDTAAAISGTFQRLAAIEARRRG